MAGKNTTGKPQTKDYNLGRGVAYLSELDSNGLPDVNGYRDLGNAPEMNITIESEDLEHQSSRAGLKVTDARFLISQTLSVTITLDELNFENLAAFLSGTVSSYDNPHDTTHTDVTITTDVVLGRWYDLKKASGARVYFLADTGVVFSVEKGPAPGSALTEGVDYVVDKKWGRIFFPSTGGTLVAGDEVIWSITTGASTPHDLDQVNALVSGQLVGALKFISENPGDGNKQTEFQFHKIRLSPTGDLALIGDEIITMQLEGVAEINNGVPDTSKVLSVRTSDTQGANFSF